MASATLVTILPETLDQSTMSSVPNSSTSATGSDKRPAIRVLAGRLRLTSYRPFPILLDASDPLVQESETQDDHIITFVSAQSQAYLEDSPPANGVTAWACQIKGRLSAFATRTIARLRRVLDHD